MLMRLAFCFHNPNHAEALNRFMRRAKAVVDAAAKRRGHEGFTPENIVKKPRFIPAGLKRECVLGGWCE